MSGDPIGPSMIENCLYFLLGYGALCCQPSSVQTLGLRERMWKVPKQHAALPLLLHPLTAQSLLSMMSESASVTGTLLFPNTKVSVAAPFGDPMP